jgi:hypothetical protein
LGAFLSTGVLL